VLQGPPLQQSPSPVEPPALSSVRDVTLGAGVPELVRGIRPVVPPLARLNAVTGSVEVRFTIDAAGQTQVLEVSGTALLQDAARAMVVSWTFRRTTAERLLALADVDYAAYTAQATVHLAH
jgi:TonB family protein